MKIYDINEIQLNKMTLQEPTRIQGGAFFSKIKYDNDDFYINTPKSETKNGIVKTGKRMYIDLLYDESNTSIINWVLDLEKDIKQKLFEKSSLWFHNDMDLDDIDYFFNSPLRTYKGNKYLLRCNVVNKTTFNNKQTIQIYDESENIKDIDDVKDKSLLSIAQICGIRFTNNSFHLEIMIKQTMILNDRQLFNTCMIKRNNNSTPESIDSLLETDSIEESSISDLEENIEDFTLDNNKEGNHDNEEDTEEALKDIESIEIENNTVSGEKEEETIKDIESVEKEHEDNEEDLVEDRQEKLEEIDSVENIEKDNNEKIIQKQDVGDTKENNHLLEVKDLGKLTNSDDLEEYSINIDEIKNDTAITLKKPNEVYYEIYREARRKAKNAKKAAIIAYLEAKNIKNTYMLDNIDDDSSDEEFDMDDLEQNLNGE